MAPYRFGCMAQSLISPHQSGRVRPAVGFPDAARQREAVDLRQAVNRRRMVMASTSEIPREDEWAYLDAIMAVSAAVAQGGALDDTLDQIAKAAAELLGVASAAIILRKRRSASGMALAGSYGLSERYADHLNETAPLEVGKGPSGVAAKTGRPVHIDDMLTHPLCGPWRQLAIAEDYRAMLCIPLNLGGEVIGVLTAYRRQPGAWGAWQVSLLSLLADHAAIAIRTADLLDRARRQVDGLSVMVRSLRAQAHEHSNRLHAIYGLLALGEPDEAKRLVASIEEGYHSVYASVTRRIENPAIAGLLVAESAIARESGIELALDRRSRLHDLPPGLADVDALTVLGNLIHNAVEAVSMMPRSKRRVSVLVLERKQETVFRVRDWGPGMSDAEIERMFERDFTRKPGHNGIGLSLVRSVVNLNGGHVRVDRMRGGGIAVTVTFSR
jgi:signal transduction histidine kinase